MTAKARHVESGTTPPISLTESGRWKFDQKTLLGILVLTITATAGWMNVKAEIRDANKRVDNLEVQIVDMKNKLASMDAKLDQLILRR